MSDIADEIQSVNPFKAQMMKKKTSFKLDTDPAAPPNTATAIISNEAAESLNPFKAQMKKRTSFNLPAGTNLLNLEKSPKREESVSTGNPYQNVLKKSPMKDGSTEPKNPYQNVLKKGAPKLDIPGDPEVPPAPMDQSESPNPFKISKTSSGADSGTQKSAEKPPIGGVKLANMNGKVDSPLQKRRQSKVFDFATIDTVNLGPASGPPKVPQSPGSFDIVSAIQDKRLIELKESYNEKLNQVVFMNDQLNKQVGDMQRKLKESNESQKKIEDTATKNYLMIKTETDKNEKLQQENMQLVKELQMERANVERLTKEKAKIEADSLKHEENLASKFSSEYQRLKQAFEVMQSRYDAKTILLSQKSQELERCLGINFEQTQTIEMLQKLSRQPVERSNLSGKSVTPRLNPRLAPATPPKNSLIVESIRSFSDEADDEQEDSSDDMIMATTPIFKNKRNESFNNDEDASTNKLDRENMDLEQAREDQKLRDRKDRDDEIRQQELRKMIDSRDSRIAHLISDIDELKNELHVLKYFVTGKDDSGKLSDEDKEGNKIEKKQRMNIFYYKCLRASIRGGNAACDAIELTDVCHLLEDNVISLQCLPRSGDELNLTLKLLNYLNMKQHQVLLQSLSDELPRDLFKKDGIISNTYEDDRVSGHLKPSEHVLSATKMRASERELDLADITNSGDIRNSPKKVFSESVGHSESINNAITMDLQQLLASQDLLNSLPPGVTLNIFAGPGSAQAKVSLKTTDLISDSNNEVSESALQQNSQSSKMSRRKSAPPKVLTNDGVEVPQLDLMATSPGNYSKATQTNKAGKIEKSPKNTKSPKNERSPKSAEHNRRASKSPKSVKKMFWSSDEEVEKAVDAIGASPIVPTRTFPSRRHTVASVGTRMSPRRPPPSSPLIQAAVKEGRKDIPSSEPERERIEYASSENDDTIKALAFHSDKRDKETAAPINMSVSSTASGYIVDVAASLVENASRPQVTPKFSSAPSVNKRSSYSSAHPSAPPVDTFSTSHYVALARGSSSASNSPSTSSIASMFCDNDNLTQTPNAATMTSPRPSPPLARKSWGGSPEVNVFMSSQGRKEPERSPSLDVFSSSVQPVFSNDSDEHSIMEAPALNRDRMSGVMHKNRQQLFERAQETRGSFDDHPARTESTISPPVRSRRGQPVSEGRRISAAAFTDSARISVHEDEWQQPNFTEGNYNSYVSLHTKDGCNFTDTVDLGSYEDQLRCKGSSIIQQGNSTARTETTPPEDWRSRSQAHYTSERASMGNVEKYEGGRAIPSFQRNYSPDDRQHQQGAEPQLYKQQNHSIYRSSLSSSESLPRQRSRERMLDMAKYTNGTCPPRTPSSVHRSPMSATQQGAYDDADRKSERCGIHDSRPREAARSQAISNNFIDGDSELSRRDFYHESRRLTDDLIRADQLSGRRQSCEEASHPNYIRNSNKSEGMHHYNQYNSRGDQYNGDSPRSDEGYEFPEY